MIHRESFEILLPSTRERWSRPGASWRSPVPGRLVTLFVGAWLVLLGLGLLAQAAAEPLAADAGSRAAGPASAEVATGSRTQSAAGTFEQRVAEILVSTPLVDGHNDAPWAIRRRWANRLQDFDFRDTSGLERVMHTDLTRLREGGVGAQLWSVWVPTELEPTAAVVALIEQIDLVHRLVEHYPDDLELALTADDVERAHGDGRIASLIGMEGSHSVACSLAVLRQAYRLGARYLTLTHWDSTAWSDSATADPVHDGLSEAGVVAIAEMNRLGMMVDLSHVSWPAMRDALEVSRAPVIFSHSNAAALNSYPRNVPDDVLERLASNGGIVMVSFAAFFVSPEMVAWVAERDAEKARLEVLHVGDPDEIERRHDQWKEANPVPVVLISDLADHIDHIAQVAGIEHVGVGSDFDGIRLAPEGLEDVSDYPALLVELARRGYSDEEIAGIAGANLLRIMRQVERVAAVLQTTEMSADPLTLVVKD